MGKTKTALIEGVETTKSGKEKYKERQKKKAEKAEKIHIAGLKGGQRIKTVTAEPLPETEPEKFEREKAKKETKIKIRGKKYLSVKAKIDQKKLYPIAEAIKTAKETSY